MCVLVWVVKTTQKERGREREREREGKRERERERGKEREGVCVCGGGGSESMGKIKQTQKKCNVSLYVSVQHLNRDSTHHQQNAINCRQQKINKQLCK